METVKSLIDHIKLTLYEINKSEKNKEDLFHNGTRAQFQNQLLHSKYLRRKLKSYYNKLHKLIYSSTFKVKFKIIHQGEETIMEAKFNNISKEEIICILELETFIHGGKIEILEIIETPTYIKKI